MWPSRAEKNPGPSVFPDFSRPQTREWWGSLFKPLVDLGVAGIWNDMNEPAVFDTPGGTMPLDVKFDNDGQPSDQRELHNVYGLLMTQGNVRGAEAAAADRAPLRPHARDLRGRSAVGGAVAGRQRLGLDRDARRDSDAARHGAVGIVVRRRGRRGLCRCAARRALHTVAAERHPLSVLAHAHRLRYTRSGAVVVRRAVGNLQSPRNRAAIRAAAAHLQRDARDLDNRPAGDAAADAGLSRRSRDLRNRRRVPVRIGPAAGAGAA